MIGSLSCLFFHRISQYEMFHGLQTNDDYATSYDSVFIVLIGF